MPLVLKPAPNEQFVVQVPPSTEVTTLRIRVWQRARHNGTRQLSAGFQMPDNVKVTREPANLSEFDRSVDRRITGGEG
jgi:hypothetical protein